MPPVTVMMMMTIMMNIMMTIMMMIMMMRMIIIIMKMAQVSQDPLQQCPQVRIMMMIYDDDDDDDGDDDCLNRTVVEVENCRTLVAIWQKMRMRTVQIAQHLPT